MKSIRYDGDKRCEKGCGRKAKFRFVKTGSLCCSSHTSSCPAVQEKRIKSAKSNIDASGLNALQRGQQAATKVKKETSGFKKAGRHISKTKNEILTNGLRRCDVSNKKMRETKLLVGKDGLTNAQRSARKMADNRLNDIDETGLNQYQRWTKERIKNGTFEKAFEKSKQIKKYLDTELYYQGTYEKRFLDNLLELYGIKWMKSQVSRGPNFNYIDTDGRQRVYMSDFCIGNTVYEIKSNWTWNRRGKDLLLEKINQLKLKSASDAGYNVILVKEGIEIEFA